MTAAGFPNDPPVTAALAREHKLTADEFARACDTLGRMPTFAELGVLSVMWSEHCSYKSSRVHLARLPTTGPRVIQGPGENAGVVDIGDGFAAIFKMESHNHPSYIEPYQGAATGVGGILRDVFTMGARPIANLDSLRFGRPDHPRTAELLRGVVSGVGDYGNAVGVPTVGGELFFDKAYDGNILVNAFTCGVAHTSRIFYGRASGVGNPVLYVGAKTGRDGIHGATMASDAFEAGGPKKRPTVQVGDPFKEKLLLEACLEIFAADVLVGVQDMGAAGLTSSSVEMAGRSGSGLDLNLDQVPRRTRGLQPYEMLLSESQERMLMVAKPGLEARVFEICEKWDLDCAIIGRVTDTGRWVVRATPGYDPFVDAPRARGAHADEGTVVVCDLPVDFLTDAAPKYDRPQADDPSLAARLAFDARAVADERPPQAIFEALIGSPNLGSRAWVYRQFDSIVRGNTRLGPGGGAAVLRVPCEHDGKTVDKILAFASDCNGRFVELDPFVGAQMAVAEVCRNLACVGASPLGLTDCLNFGNPERPEIMRQIARAIDGIAEACRALEVPVISGNVSLYNETSGRAILPTPTVAAVGIAPDLESVCGAAFPSEGLEVFVIGAANGGPLGGSSYLTDLIGDVKGALPALDLALEVRLQSLVRSLIHEKIVKSAHDVADGGLAVTLAECCVVGRAKIGVTTAITSSEPAREALFGEAPSRIVISVEASSVARFEAHAQRANVPIARLGRTGGDRLEIALNGAVVVAAQLDAIADRRDRCLDAIVGSAR